LRQRFVGGKQSSSKTFELQRVFYFPIFHNKVESRSNWGFLKGAQCCCLKTVLTQHCHFRCQWSRVHCIQSCTGIGRERNPWHDNTSTWWLSYQFVTTPSFMTFKKRFKITDAAKNRVIFFINLVHDATSSHLFSLVICFLLCLCR
jgi:hypothetical protein